MELVHDAHKDLMKSPVSSVSSDYVLVEKSAEPHVEIRLGESKLKWYHLGRPDEPVTDDARKLAIDFLQKRAWSEEYLGELGFVILHRCGPEFYFLLVATWQNNNEVWESVFAKRSDAEDDFSPFTFETHHRGTFCVWELGIVNHEKDAWKRFLLSERSQEDREAYLNDLYYGKA